MKNRIIEHYSQHAEHYQGQYDSVEFQMIHSEWLPILDDIPLGSALDVGAGSGRDARWLNNQGWQVTAVEPAEVLRELGKLNSDAAIQWVDADLPTLTGVTAPNEGFRLILLSAVWMHLATKERKPALQRLKSMLSRDGIIVVTLRFGPSDARRPMYPVSTEELSLLAKANHVKLFEVDQKFSADKLQRQDIHWKTVIISHNREKWALRKNL